MNTFTVYTPSAAEKALGWSLRRPIKIFVDLFNFCFRRCGVRSEKWSSIEAGQPKRQEAAEFIRPLFAMRLALRRGLPELDPTSVTTIDNAPSGNCDTRPETRRDFRSGPRQQKPALKEEL